MSNFGNAGTDRKPIGAAPDEIVLTTSELAIYVLWPLIQIAGTGARRRGGGNCEGDGCREAVQCETFRSAATGRSLRGGRRKP
jgi:hypothetical protein